MVLLIFAVVSIEFWLQPVGRMFCTPTSLTNDGKRGMEVASVTHELENENGRKQVSHTNESHRDYFLKLTC
jgi:hypothetical protein